MRWIQGGGYSGTSLAPGWRDLEIEEYNEDKTAHLGF